MLLQGLVRVLMLDECYLLWGDLSGYVWGKTNERIEVDMTNYRNKQTYFEAVDYHTRYFLFIAYPKGNSDHTIEFLQYLLFSKSRTTFGGDLGWSQLSSLRTNAAVFRASQCRQNRIKLATLLPSICTQFPGQNLVEDIWLQAKTYVRQHYYQCPSFKSLKQLFMQFLSGRVFDSPKLHAYG